MIRFPRSARLLALPLLMGATLMTRAARPDEPGKVVRAEQIGGPVTPLSVDVDVRTLPVVRPWRPGQAIREVPRRNHPAVNPALSMAPAWHQTSPDRLGELQDRTGPDNSSRAFNAPGVNVAGNGSTGVNPPDVAMDVGPNHVIQALNGSGGAIFRIYDKAGTLLAGPTAMESLAPSGDACALGYGDPIILYDRMANRWFMLEFTDGSNNLCVYISKTANPVTGGWWFYKFLANAFPDYPHCAVWSDSYVCTTNESGSGAPIYAYDRANMLNGATARAQQRFTATKLGGYGFQALTPATHNGATAPPAGAPVIIARHNDDEAHAGASAVGTTDYIDLYSLAVNWTTPASSALTTLPRVNITEFNSWFHHSSCPTTQNGYSCFATVPQPGSTAAIDPIREIIHNSMIYRNFGTYQSIVGVFATNQNAARTGTTVDAALRWFELRKTGTGNWLLQQEGTFSPGDSATHHFMGAIAMDKQGNIALGYNVAKTSATTVFPSLKYTGRLAGDAAGTMTQGETSLGAGAAANSSGRWGDYAQMAVDPADDCTFWISGMYQPSSSWATRVASFKFDGCTTGATYSISGSAGVASATVSWSGAASGSTTADASGNYTISGLANGSYTVTPSRSGYTFSPVNRAVTVASANVTGQNFTATPVAVTYSISGSAGTASAAIAWSGAASGSTTADASGNYTISGLANGTYTVTPTKSGCTFSPVNRSVTIASANVTGQSFTATCTTGDTQLTNGVTVASQSVALQAWKYYYISVPSGQSSITFRTTVATTDIDIYAKLGSKPTGTGDTGVACKAETSSGVETCSVTNPAAGTWWLGVYGYAASSNFSVSATHAGTTTYTISGSAGTASANINYSGPSTGAVAADASGNYSITGRAAGTYTITPSKSGCTFSPTSLSVTVGPDATGRNFTATCTTGDTQLTNGVTVASQSVALGAWKYYYISVPAGQTSITFRTTVATTDIDIFAKLGSKPTGTTDTGVACKAETSSGAETCSVTNPAAGTWWLGVYGYAASTNFSVSATYTGSTVTALTSGVAVASSVNGASANASWKDFSITVPAGRTTLTMTTTGASGDVDLYTKLGSAPSLSVYDCRPWTGTGNETCVVNAPAAGTYYIRVYNYATGNLTFNVTATY